HERAALTAGIGHHALLLRPVARDVELAVREPERPLALTDLDRRLDLAVAVEARAVFEDQRADVARVRVVAVRRARDRDLFADREQIRRPPRAAQRVRGAHLAAHRDRFAVLADDVE